MLAGGHRSHDGRKGDELLLLGAQERIRLEEWDDLPKQIESPSNNEDQRGVARHTMVLPDPTAAKPSLKQVEDLPSLGVLADVELGHELESSFRARAPTDGDVK